MRGRRRSTKTKKIASAKYSNICNEGRYKRTEIYDVDMQNFVVPVNKLMTCHKVSRLSSLDDAPT